MNKQTKMLLGLAAVAGVGYYIWQKNKPATKANVAGVNNMECKNPYSGSGGCWKGSVNKAGGYEQCKNGSWCKTGKQ